MGFEKKSLSLIIVTMVPRSWQTMVPSAAVHVDGFHLIIGFYIATNSNSFLPFCKLIISSGNNFFFLLLTKKIVWPSAAKWTQKAMDNLLYDFKQVMSSDQYKLSQRPVTNIIMDICKHTLFPTTGYGDLKIASICLLLDDMIT